MTTSHGPSRRRKVQVVKLAHRRKKDGSAVIRVDFRVAAALEAERVFQAARKSGQSLKSSFIAAGRADPEWSGSNDAAASRGRRLVEGADLVRRGARWGRPDKTSAYRPPVARPGTQYSNLPLEVPALAMPVRNKKPRPSRPGRGSKLCRFLIP